MGDIVAICNTSGNVVARYNYDAFGKCTIAGGSNITIANANSFRYRGYYLDQETGFYFLNSRYYSPEFRRFISPDDTNYLDPETPNGLNLYCYCNNDPVNYADPSGTFAISSFLIGLGIAAAIGAGVGAASYVAGQVIDYTIAGAWEWSWGGFAGSILGGALGGMAAYCLTILGRSAWAIFANGMITNAMIMSGENFTRDADHTIEDIITISFVAGATSSISSGVMKNIKFVPINSGKGSYSAVAKQIYTKILNGSIGRVSSRTLGKMLISELYDGLFALLLE